MNPEYPQPQKQATNNKYFKIAIVSLIIVGLAILSLVIWQKIQNQGKVAIGIRKLPSDAKIVLNDKTISSSTIYLEPGTYTLKGSSEGFADYERTIDIPDNSEDLKAFFVLDPKSDEALKQVGESTEEYLKLEKEASEYYAKTSEQTADKYPIIEDLPYRSPLYSIEYSLVKDDFKIQIKSSDALGRQVAIGRIKDFGYPPTDYIIEFLGLDNPFTQSGVNND